MCASSAAVVFSSCSHAQQFYFIRPIAPLTSTLAASYLAVAMAQYVTFQGMQLPHFHDSHLRTLHPTKLREHANLLYSTIGHSNLGRAVPVHDHELIEFIIFVQKGPLSKHPNVRHCCRRWCHCFTVVKSRLAQPAVGWGAGRIPTVI